MTRIKPLKNKADILFSLYIRRDGKCERCGRQNIRLECAHIFTRKFVATRYDPDNALCLCSSCHRFWHDQPAEAVEWLKEYYTEKKYDQLRLKAKTRLVRANELYYREIIDKLKTNQPPYERG